MVDMLPNREYVSISFFIKFCIDSFLFSCMLYNNGNWSKRHSMTKNTQNFVGDGYNGSPMNPSISSHKASFPWLRPPFFERVPIHSLVTINNLLPKHLCQLSSWFQARRTQNLPTHHPRFSTIIETWTLLNLFRESPVPKMAHLLVICWLEPWNLGIMLIL